MTLHVDNCDRRGWNEKRAKQKLSLAGGGLDLWGLHSVELCGT